VKDEDEVGYLMSYNEAKTRVTLHIIAPEPMDTETYLQCLAIYLDDLQKDPKRIFDPDTSIIEQES